MSAPSHVISGGIDDDTMYQTNEILARGKENSAKRDRNDGVTLENKGTVVIGISPNADLYTCSSK